MITQKMTQQIVVTHKRTQTHTHSDSKQPKSLCRQVDDDAGVCLRGKFAGCAEPNKLGRQHKVVGLF
jgi:hypothetical protein